MNIFISIIPIFSNFKVGPTLLADWLVLFFLVWFAIKQRLYTRNVSFISFLILFVLLFSFAVFDFSIMGSNEAFNSRLRFLFGLLFSFIIVQYANRDDSRAANELVSAYVDVAAICSIFVILQVIFFYIFRFTIPFGFGTFTLSASSLYDSSLQYMGVIRTGGFFREPSFYTLYVFPSIFLADKQSKSIHLYLIIFGLLLSTSGLGVLLLLLFLTYRMRSNLHAFFVLMALLFCIIMIIINFLPDTFARFEHLLSGGSSKIRILQPLEKFVTNAGNNFFGDDGLTVYDNTSEAEWVNSLVFIFYLFGLLGLIGFVIYLSVQLSMFYLAVFLLLSIIEGAVGRSDYWFVLAMFIVLSKFEVVKGKVKGSLS